MNLENTAITTGRHLQKEKIALAKKLANEWKIPYVFRGSDSIEEIKERENLSHILVVKENKLALATEEGEFFFHPNLAKMRLNNLERGGEDYLITALNIANGSRVLDCTLGFGSDAIIESYAVGDTGKVIALEKNPVIATVIGYGLKHNKAEGDIEKYMRGIEIINADALTFLQNQADNSFDAVYFDPMFRHPLMESENLRPLRTLAEISPITIETIAEAKRVAKNRVVLKENARSLEFERLGFTEFVGGKYSKIKFGVYDASDGKGQTK